MDPSGQLLRMRDVAWKLNVSVRSAYQLAAAGQLPSVRFGRTVRVRDEDLARFIQASLASAEQASHSLAAAQAFPTSAKGGKND